MKYFWDNVLLLKRKGEFLLELGEYDAAIDVLEYLLSTGKPAEEANFLLGRCHFEKGDYKKALQVFKENLKHAKKEEGRFNSLCFIALCYQRLGKPRLMREYFIHAKDFGEGWVTKFFQEGFRHLRKRSQFREGIMFGKQQLKDYPDNAVLHHYLGEFYMELEEYDKAIERLSRAVKLDPEREWTRFSLGKCFYLTGRYEEAKKAFKDNLRLTSDKLSHYHSWIFLAMAADAKSDKKGRLKALQSLKGFKEFNGNETPLEQKFLTKLKQEKRLPRWLEKKT